MFGIKYSSDIVICAFVYIATSRSLHCRLWEYFQLPPLATLKSFKNSLKIIFAICISWSSCHSKRQHNSLWWSIYQENAVISWQTIICESSWQFTSLCSNRYGLSARNYLWGVCRICMQAKWINSVSGLKMYAQKVKILTHAINTFLKEIV